MDAERLEQILIGPESTVRDAVEAIDAGKAHLAVVVDAERRLVGTVTDGDVRRALLHGAALDEPVERVLHRGAVTAPAVTAAPELLALMEQHKIDQVPLLDGERLVDVALLRDLVESGSGHPVVIVAGGEGRRLRPLTEETPKPMLEVGGRPLLESVLGRVRGAGLSKVFLLVNYRADAIESHFGDGREFGVDITYVHEEQPLGSAGGLDALRAQLDEPFLVMNADLVTDVDFTALMRSHVEEENLVTVGVKPYVLEVPYGVVELEGTSVAELREKPEVRFFVNAGIYALSPEAVRYVPAEGGGEFHMTHLIERALEAGARVGSFAIREYWLDIGQMSDYERANEDHVTRLFHTR